MSLNTNANSIAIEKPTHQVLIIDLENCPNQIKYLMDSLEQYAQIVICYAQSSAKIPLDWVIPLTTVINDNRLKIIKMPSGGKNAADFGIAFWSGMLMAKTEANAHFDIVSDDADLDHVVSLINSLHASAKRIRTNKSPQDEKLSSLTATMSDPVREYCLHLDTHQKNRPVKKETLINHIKSKFNGSGVDAEKLLEALCKQEAIKLVDNKISYNQSKITALAKALDRPISPKIAS